MLQPHASTRLAAQQGVRPGASQALSANAEWPLAQRLVVLVPAGLTDELSLAARIFDAAQQRRTQVLYLGLVARPEDEPSLRRRLALLAAYTRDNHAIRAEYRLAVASDWLAWLKLCWSPGDLVICHAEQQVSRLGSTRPLGHVLAERLGQPVVMLEGFCRRETGPAFRLARSIAFWVGAFVIIGASFALQVSVQRALQNGSQPVWLALTVMVEFGLLAAWSKQLQ